MILRTISFLIMIGSAISFCISLHAYPIAQSGFELLVATISWLAIHFDFTDEE